MIFFMNGNGLFCVIGMWAYMGLSPLRVWREKRELDMSKIELANALHVPKAGKRKYLIDGIKVWAYNEAGAEAKLRSRLSR